MAVQRREFSVDFFGFSGCHYRCYHSWGNTSSATLPEYHVGCTYVTQRDHNLCLRNIFLFQSSPSGAIDDVRLIGRSMAFGALSRRYREHCCCLLSVVHMRRGFLSFSLFVCITDCVIIIVVLLLVCVQHLLFVVISDGFCLLRVFSKINSR